MISIEQKHQNQNPFSGLASAVSPIPPKTAKADLRREISPWRALCWAYADECVGVATNVPDDHHLFLSNGLTQTTYGERMARGSINGALDAHEDAFAIDGWLYRVLGGKDGMGKSPRQSPYHRIRLAAEQRKAIPPSIEVPLIQCVPTLNRRGDPVLLYPLNRNDRPYLCVVGYEGYPPEKAEAMRRAHEALYDLFTKAMACMVDLKLSKWRVVVS
jgi:hypothetical protein